MEISGNTVLITGGATGIGLAMAESFLEAGSKIIICGRREERLHEAQRKHIMANGHTATELISL